jgi:hypothetical protein
MIEDQLRATLHERAADVTPETIQRVAQAQYHPRTHRWTTKRPALKALTGSAALAAGGIGTAIALLGGASPAFAGWSATPTAPAQGQLQQALQACQSRAPVNGLPLVLSDTRGPFTFAIYADSASSTICTTGPNFQSAQGSSSSQPVTVPADQLQLTQDRGTNAQDDTYAFADGRAGSDVTGATLNLSDGTQVQATVQNGWFVAWWPGDASVTSATLTTSSGTSTQTFPAFASGPSCPSGAACSFSSGGTAGGAGGPGGGSSSFGIRSVGGGTSTSSAGSSQTATTSVK